MMPYDDFLTAGLRLGWMPSEIWAATLYELETAIWLRTSDAQQGARALTEDETRSMLEAMSRHA